MQWGNILDIARNKDIEEPNKVYHNYRNTKWNSREINGIHERQMKFHQYIEKTYMKKPI